MTRLRIEVYPWHGSLEIDVAVCAAILTTSLSRGSAWCLHKAGRQWKGSHLCLDLGAAWSQCIAFGHAMPCLSFNQLFTPSVWGRDRVRRPDFYISLSTAMQLSLWCRPPPCFSVRSVRYVYQPMESLNLVVITNKASNILEDSLPHSFHWRWSQVASWYILTHQWFGWWSSALKVVTYPACSSDTNQSKIGNGLAGLGNATPVSKGSPWWQRPTFHVCWTKVRRFADIWRLGIFCNPSFKYWGKSTWNLSDDLFSVCDPLAPNGLLQWLQGCPRLLRDSSLWGKCLGTWCESFCQWTRKLLTHPDVRIRWRSMTRNVCVCVCVCVWVYGMWYVRWWTCQLGGIELQCTCKQRNIQNPNEGFEACLRHRLCLRWGH